MVTKELKVLLKTVLVGVGLIILLKYLFPLVAPFLLGAVFACLIEPLVKKMDQTVKLGRKLAVILVLIILVLIIFLICSLSLFSFYVEAERLIPKIPEFINRFIGFSQFVLRYLGQHFPQIPFNLKKLSIPVESLEHIFRSLILGVLNLLPRFPQIIVAIGLGGVTAYFFSRDKMLISQKLLHVLSPSWKKNIIALKEEMILSTTRFIRVECTLALITTIITMISFYFMGIPGALAFGFLSGILDFLPVLGPGLIYIPYAMINLMFGNHSQAIWLMATYFILLLVRQIIEIKLIGNNLSLHPIISILIIYLGWNLFGFAGIFYAPILTITLRACYRIFMGIQESQLI